MIGITAQLSLYPLGQQDLAPAIQAVVDTLAAHGLPAEVGAMSTVTYGDDEAVFAALRAAFVAAAQYGGAVLTVTVSNACPLPARGARDG
ncbi:MAG: YkoF family thiamine/hydroxymethylpyrimidine-binding protein [Anaerolineae bacterium]